MTDVLETRLAALEARVKTLEVEDRAWITRENDRYTAILVELGILKTRVGFLAAGIGGVTGIVSGVTTSVIVLAIKSAAGG